MYFTRQYDGDVAHFESLLQVPANRAGYTTLSLP